MAEAGSERSDLAASLRCRGEAAATADFVTGKAGGYADDMRASLRSLLCFVGTVILCGGGLPAVDAATVYRWVDADGVVHWSDRPVAGSTSVELPAAQGYRPVAPKSGNSLSGSTAAPADYTGLLVTAPTDGADLVAADGLVQCTAQLTPRLAAGDTLWFELDGQRYDTYGSASMSLPVPRGEHTLRALVLAADSRVRLASDPVVFRVHQASVVQPPTGPLLKRPR